MNGIKVLDAFHWTREYPSPDSSIVAVEGFQGYYPYEIRFYCNDIELPIMGMQLEIKGNYMIKWLNNNACVFTHYCMVSRRYGDVDELDYDDYIRLNQMEVFEAVKYKVVLRRVGMAIKVWEYNQVMK
jgi:hypothetical protein